MAAAATANGGHDGAFGAPGDVRLESGFADTLNDVLDLLFSGVVGHVDDHGDYLSVLPPKTKAAISIAALAESLSCLYCLAD